MLSFKCATKALTALKRRYQVSNKSSKPIASVFAFATIRNGGATTANTHTHTNKGKQSNRSARWRMAVGVVVVVVVLVVASLLNEM